MSIFSLLAGMHLHLQKKIAKMLHSGFTKVTSAFVEKNVVQNFFLRADLFMTNDKRWVFTNAFTKSRFCKFKCARMQLLNGDILKCAKSDANQNYRNEKHAINIHHTLCLQKRLKIAWLRKDYVKMGRTNQSMPLYR